MIIANIVSLILVVIGALNWGLIGIFNFNLVTAIFGVYPSILTVIVYILVAVAAIWLVISLIMASGRLLFCTNRENK